MTDTQNEAGGQQPVDLKCTSQKLGEMLERTKWASDFSWVQILKISAHMRAFRIAKGTTIIREGTMDQSLCIIVEGMVNIVKADGRESRVLATLMPSQSFGEMSLIDGEPRSASVVAASEVVMLMLDKKSFLEMGKTVPGLALKLLWKLAIMVSQRLRKTTGQLLEHLHDVHEQKPGKPV